MIFRRVQPGEHHVFGSLVRAQAIASADNITRYVFMLPSIPDRSARETFTNFAGPCGAPDAMTRIGQRLEPGLGDRLLALLAAAQRALPDTLQGLADFSQHQFLILHQTERELLLKIVGGHVGQVRRSFRAARLGPVGPRASLARCDTSPRSRLPRASRVCLIALQFRLGHRGPRKSLGQAALCSTNSHDIPRPKTRQGRRTRDGGRVGVGYTAGIGPPQERRESGAPLELQ